MSLYPRIGRTPNFGPIFLGKKCGLSAGIYGKRFSFYKYSSALFTQMSQFIKVHCISNHRECVCETRKVKQKRGRKGEGWKKRVLKKIFVLKNSGTVLDCASFYSLIYIHFVWKTKIQLQFVNVVYYIEAV